MGIFNEVIDITHHSKRTQAGNLAKANPDRVTNTTTEETVHKVPVNVTIETAIEYFRSNATGENANLYSFTAEVLDKYRLLTKKSLKELSDCPSGDVLTVNMNEVE